MNKLYFVLLLPFILFASPDWFYNIKPSQKNEIIGYGVSENLNLAKQNTIDDIVKTISVDVITQTDISKSNIDGKYSRNSSSNFQTKSKATLSGVKVLKVEEIDGKWYVASSYDNSPIEIKFKKSLLESLSDETQNLYLSQTELIKKLNNEIGFRLNYKLIRKDNLWQLNYKDISLPLSQNEFYKLFTDISSEHIVLETNKQKYNLNDEVSFKLNLMQKGYVSILYVEHDGKVGILTANKLIHHNFTFPDFKSTDTFKIANPYNKSILELYVAIYSNKPINLNNFENVNEQYLDETNYNFDKLISLLSTYEFSTKIIKISK